MISGCCVFAQDCSHIDEHGIAAALLPLVTAFCRVSYFNLIENNSSQDIFVSSLLMVRLFLIAVIIWYSFSL